MTRRRHRLAIMLLAMIMVGSVSMLAPPVARASTASSPDGARATGPETVVVGQPIVITGTGWTAPAVDGSTAVGSVIAVKLDDGALSGTTAVINPASQDPISNRTVFAAVQADTDGEFRLEVPFPTLDNATGSWAAGGEHALRLLTGSLLSGDVLRTLELRFDVVAAAEARPSGTPSATVSARPGGGSSLTPSASASLATPSPASPSPGSPSPGSPSPATPSPEIARRTGCPANTTVAVSAATTTGGLPSTTVGGKVRLTGTGFCDLGGGGSRIAIKINDGAYSRLDTSVHDNTTIWQIVDAAAGGRLDATVTMPTADETKPAFGPGSYTLRLLTGSLKDDDTQRTLQTGEIVVTDGASNGTLPAPSGTPDPVDPVTALVSGTAGGVTVTQRGSRLTITVPQLEPGEWAFPYVFGRQQVAGFDETAYEPFPTTWLQLDADRTVSVDLADHNVDGTSAWRVSLQDRNQKLAGWAAVSSFASSTDDDDEATTTSTSSTSETLAETGGSRPVVLVLGLLLVLVGSLVLRRATTRGSR